MQTFTATAEKKEFTIIFYKMADPISSWLETIKTFPNLIKEIYGDIAKPGVQQAGIAIGRLIKIPNLFLCYVDYFDDKNTQWRKKNLEKYRDKLADIPIEKTCEVPPEIGVPILERLAYTSSSEIADLFIELLTKSSSIDTISEVHPSYIHLITMLSPDEAKIIIHMKNIKNDFIPYIQFKVNEKEKSGYVNLGNCLTFLELNPNLLFKKNISLYLDNLEGLGIISKQDGIYTTNTQNYEILYDVYAPGALEIIRTNNFPNLENIIRFSRGLYKITKLGKAFIESCTSKSSIFNMPIVGPFNYNFSHSRFKIGNKVSFGYRNYGSGSIRSIFSENEIGIEKDSGEFWIVFGDMIENISLFEKSR